MDLFSTKKGESSNFVLISESKKMNGNRKILIDITIRPEIGRIGNVDCLHSKNFRLENGNAFFIKVEGDHPVRLKVFPADDTDRNFIETLFYPGWNVELVKEIEMTPDLDCKIQYGY